MSLNRRSSSRVSNSVEQLENRIVQTGYVGSAVAGYVTVPVPNSAFSGTATVEVSTSDGTAVAGVDYTPIDQTITFKPGDPNASVRIPLINHGGNTSGLDKTFNVNIKDTATGVTSGTPDTVYVSPTADTTLPAVQSVRFQTAGKGNSPRLTGVVITFNKAMDATQVSNVDNYVLETFHQQNIHQPNDTPFPIASAKYNSSTHSVTLTTQKPLATSTLYYLAFDSYNTLGWGFPSPITDAAGVPVSAQPLAPAPPDNTIGADGYFSAYIERGTTIGLRDNYSAWYTTATPKPDTSSSLKLTGGGTLEVVVPLFGTSGAVVTVLNPAKHSILKGTTSNEVSPGINPFTSPSFTPAVHAMPFES